MEIIDQHESDETGVVLTTVAKLNWKLACTWMITSAVMGLSGCIILLAAMYKFGALEKMGFEGFAFSMFLAVMSLKFIAQIYNGYQSKKSLLSNDKKGIEVAALQYSYIWIMMGVLAVLFIFCMLIYFINKTNLLGEISGLLFKIP